jgi:hypothetical protein
MRSFWSDPYLWVHLAGIAALPVFLELCLVGMATGEPLLPLWVELLFVGGVGILPILWMQWQRPFSIFSLPLIALKPTRYTDDQRRIIHLFKSSVNRGLAVLVAVGMAWLLWQLYQVAPFASPAPFLGSASRGVGLLIAAIAFLGCNLFVQIPVSVLAVLLTSEAKFAATEPYPMGQIGKDFTLPGIRVLHLLPPLIAERRQPTVAAAPASISAPAPAIDEERAGLDVEVNTNITAVEITEEAAVPDDFEEEAVTEEAEGILDLSTAPLGSDAATSTDTKTDTNTPIEDVENVFVTELETGIETTPELNTIAETETITEVEPAEPAEPAEPIEADLTEANITEASFVSDTTEAELAPDDVPQLEEESSISETIEFTEGIEQNDGSQAASMAESMAEANDGIATPIDDRVEPLEASSEANIQARKPEAQDEAKLLSQDISVNVSREVVDGEERIAGTIEIIEDDSVTETYEIEISQTDSDIRETDA